MGADAIVGLVTDLGAFGFILWLVHRTFSHTIPRLAGGFEDAIKSMQAAFEKHSDQQREDFREMVQRQREDYERMMAREQELHAGQAEKIVKALDELAREVRAT